MKRWQRSLKMRKIVLSNHFRKDLKLARNRGLNLNLLKTVINILASGETLSRQYRDHDLTGNYAGCRECHIQPDWLLVYRIEQEELELSRFKTTPFFDAY